MMSRGKSISVKIATKKVIEALETALTAKKSFKETFKAKKAEYDKALLKWEADVVKLVKPNSKHSAVSVRPKHHYNIEKGGYEVVMTFDVPFADVPQAPEAPENINDWQLKDQIEEIENAIRILKMTEDEYVSTSTYNSIARFL